MISCCPDPERFLSSAGTALGWRAACRGDSETLEDAAFGCCAFAPAAVAQRLQLAAQPFQLPYAPIDLSQVLIEQVSHRGATLRRAVDEPQQQPDFVERHIERAAMPDKGEPVHVRLVVDAVVARGAPERAKQLLPLVETNGLDVCLCGLCQFADLHVMFTMRSEHCTACAAGKRTAAGKEEFNDRR